ncbi:MAG: DUF1569 domain-containing protein [Planctomycetes bacterium]|nr:DUF1569 domain-containing protein [Planctomycetota bacterium]
MRKTLFRPEDKEEMLARIRRLTPSSRPLWGKMGVAQMFAHCSVGLRAALSDLKPKRALMGILFGRLAKRGLTNDKPFGRNLPTGPEFKITEPRDFDRERRELEQWVERFASGGDAALSPHPHPFFGVLTSAEWQALMWKHLDHHLRQFGA